MAAIRMARTIFHGTFEFEPMKFDCTFKVLWQHFQLSLVGEELRCPSLYYFWHKQAPELSSQGSVSNLDNFLTWKKSLAGFKPLQQLMTLITQSWTPENRMRIYRY